MRFIEAKNLRKEFHIFEHREGIWGTVICISIFVVISSVNFWFEDRIRLAPPFFDMIAFGRHPIIIYSTVIQFFLSWIIPFVFASFYPTVGYLGRTEFRTEFFLMPVVAAALTGIALLVWERGILQYKSTGS